MINNNNSEPKRRQSKDPIVLFNAMIIDGNGYEPISNGFVVIEGERIKEVSQGSPNKIPSNAIQINCRQQALLPGLIDAHVHMGAIEATLADQHRLHFTSMWVIQTLQRIKATLEHGFTTARDVGGIDPGFREAVEQGLIPGPRLFVAGQALSQTGGHGDKRFPAEQGPSFNHPVALSWVCDGVDAVRRAAREQLRQGVDHVKVMAGGGVNSPGDEINASQYSVEELKAIVFEAESAGKYVSAHLYSVRSILNCIEAGVRSLEHGNLLDEKAAKAIRDADAFLVPTLAAHEMGCRMGKELGQPEYYIRKCFQAREASLRALEIAHKTGVRIASGSDLLGPKHEYQAIELELKARVLGSMGAIVATTKTNAELLRREHDLGTIAVGKLADIILVDGNPLKDISVLQQYHEKITLIMKGGKIFKNILV